MKGNVSYMWGDWIALCRKYYLIYLECDTSVKDTRMYVCMYIYGEIISTKVSFTAIWCFLLFHCGTHLITGEIVSQGTLNAPKVMWRSTTRYWLWHCCSSSMSRANNTLSVQKGMVLLHHNMMASVDAGTKPRLEVSPHKNIFSLVQDGL